MGVFSCLQVDGSIVGGLISSSLRGMVQKESKVLCMGASIGIQGEATGIIGAIVEDGSTLYALSCNHVTSVTS